jgi:hypothetical protein
MFGQSTTSGGVEQMVDYGCAVGAGICFHDGGDDLLHLAAECGFEFVLLGFVAIGLFNLGLGLILVDKPGRGLAKNGGQPVPKRRFRQKVAKSLPFKVAVSLLSPARAVATASTACIRRQRSAAITRGSIPCRCHQARSLPRPCNSR